MISPTVGRVVWYWPNGNMDKAAGSQPWAASIAYVHGDRMVNIGYLDSGGTPGAATSVLLVQPGDPLPELGGYCEWMPYQHGQAAKVDNLEPRLAELERLVRPLG